MTERTDLSGKFIKVTATEPHVLLVELARNPVNSFTEEFWNEFGIVFDNISKDPTIRAVVLASALPKLFSAGIDFSGLDNLKKFHQDPARKGLQLREFILSFQHSISAVERCPYPVIAAVHGFAIGLSIDIITACDVRYGAQGSHYSVKEVDLGLAADIGTLARLPKVAGNQSLVSEVALTARDFDVSEALQMGLISRIVPGGREEVLRAALETAHIIAQKSPIAVLGTKRVLQHSRDHSVAENLEYVATWNSAMLQTVDTSAALQAAMAKKSPSFPPLGKLPTPKL